MVAAGLTPRCADAEGCSSSIHADRPSPLSYGLPRVSFVALWNGEPGDGPGGTESMVALVRKLTGHQPIIIAPATL